MGATAPAGERRPARIDIVRGPIVETDIKQAFAAARHFGTRTLVLFPAHPGFSLFRFPLRVFFSHILSYDGQWRGCN
jgi:hypothetical protein